MDDGGRHCQLGLGLGLWLVFVVCAELANSHMAPEDDTRSHSCNQHYNLVQVDWLRGTMGGATAGCGGDIVPPPLRPRGYRGYNEDDVQFSV